MVLKTEKIDVDLVPVRNDPDEAGFPKWLFQEQDAILAVDVDGYEYGTNWLDQP